MRFSEKNQGAAVYIRSEGREQSRPFEKGDAGMKRAVALLVVLVLMTGGIANASITVNPIDLRTGDVINYQSQTYSGSGSGGPFTWKVQSTVTRTDGATPPAVGTVFYTFCTELTQYIGDPIALQTIVAASAYSAWVDMKGAWLFEQWADSNTSFVSHDSASDSHVVQVAIWRSLGWTTGGGYTTTQWTSYLAIADAWLEGMPKNWVPDATSKVMVFGANQDQIYLGIVGGSGLPGVPEPTSLAIWGLGSIGVGAAAAIRRRKAPRSSWSEQSRSAIYHVIEGKR